VNQGPNWLVITLRTGPKFVDSPLMLFLRMGQLPCRFQFCLNGLVTHWLCETANELICNFLTYITRICLTSVGYHFQNAAVTASISVVLIKTAKHWFCWWVMKSIFNHLTYMTRIHLPSTDSQFQDGAVTVSISVLPIKTATTLVLLVSYQINIQSPYLQDQKSLTLRWRWCWCIL